MNNVNNFYIINILILIILLIRIIIIIIWQNLTGVMVKVSLDIPQGTRFIVIYVSFLLTYGFWSSSSFFLYFFNNTFSCDGRWLLLIEVSTWDVKLHNDA